MLCNSDKNLGDRKISKIFISKNSLIIKAITTLVNDKANSDF